MTEQTQRDGKDIQGIARDIESLNGLSDLEKALLFASRVHEGQLRKGTRIPYVSHLLAVVSTVLEDGGSEEEVIAALLHDAPEDQGGPETLELIKAMFGNRVAQIVEGLSDTFEDPKPPWPERKATYLLHLQDAPDEVIRVSLADKLHNARSILRDLKSQGESIWDRFRADRDDQIDYYRSLVAIFEARRPGVLADELAEIVTSFGNPSWVPEPPSCPRCGGSDVKAILYGLPGPEASHAAQRGEIVLGGCLVFGDDPEWECQSCGGKWRSGSPVAEPPDLLE